MYKPLKKLKIFPIFFLHHFPLHSLNPLHISVKSHSPKNYRNKLMDSCIGFDKSFLLLLSFGNIIIFLCPFIFYTRIFYCF